MDEQEGGCVLPKATRAHIGPINHSLDCGSIYIQELFIYLPNCPCPSAIPVPPQKKRIWITCVCVLLSVTFTLSILTCCTQAQVFITNYTRILLVPALCRSVRDLSLHSVQSPLGCF